MHDERVGVIGKEANIGRDCGGGQSVVRVTDEEYGGRMRRVIITQTRCRRRRCRRMFGVPIRSCQIWPRCGQRLCGRSDVMDAS